MQNIHFFLLMIFLHICDDYYLQGWLASAKQKGWWEKNAPQEKYRYDYLMALFMHSFSWAFMIMLPTLYYYNFTVNSLYLYLLGVNLIIHMATDNAKANCKTINLLEDQAIHLTQITWTYIIVFCSLSN